MDKNVKVCIGKTAVSDRANKVKLAERRKSVYKYLIDGVPIPTIANRMNLSERTITRDKNYILEHYVRVDDEINAITTQAQWATREALQKYVDAKEQGNQASEQHWYHNIIRSLGLRSTVAGGPRGVNVQINTVNGVDDETLKIYNAAKIKNDKEVIEDEE